MIFTLPDCHREQAFLRCKKRAEFFLKKRSGGLETDRRIAIFPRDGTPVATRIYTGKIRRPAMNMVRYRDWPTGLNLQNELRRVVDRMFEGGAFEQDTSDDSSIVTSQWTPRVDILEEPERFVLLADLPGIDPADIEVSMDDGILTIKGERKSQSASRTDRFSRLERSYGMFHRRFALPGSADAQGISAQGRNGVLEVSIPKRPETTPRRIQVNHLGGRALEDQTSRQ